LNAEVVPRPDGLEVYVRPVGDLDLQVAEQLWNDLERLVRGGLRHVVIDCSRVTFLGAATVAVLLRTMAALEPCEGSLALLNPAPLVEEVLQVVNLHHLVVRI
jgi:anti-sigma B factor antagonist